MSRTFCRYVPLGPFNGKNFCTQISPWVVPLEALEPFACEAPLQDPPALPYLQHPNRETYDLQLSVDIIPAGCQQAARVSTSNLKYLYWTFPQMAVHHTVGGCNLRPGDLMGSGTISGNEEHELGCLLEMSRGGSRDVVLLPAGSSGSEMATEGASTLGRNNASGETGQTGGGGNLNCTPHPQSGASGAAAGSVVRRYLLDGDTVVLSGHCQGDGYRVGFGECRGTVLPSRAQG